MTFVAGLLQAYIAAFLVGVGVGVLLMALVRMVRSVFNVTD